MVGRGLQVGNRTRRTGLSTALSCSFRRSQRLWTSDLATRPGVSSYVPGSLVCEVSCGEGEHASDPGSHISVQTEKLLAELADIVGPEGVCSTAEECAFYSVDLSAHSVAIAAAVVRPENIGQLTASVAACARKGMKIVPRGGGTSYSSGYTPMKGGTIILDLRALDRIIEINIADMYVVVECGCTWQRLQEELRKHGVRTPYFGPISGIRASVGGVLSNNSLFMGTETAGDTVLGLHIVSADGTILRTGSDSLRGRKPFFRQFGPDITGLFVGDGGAFGIKTVAILRLRPLPGATRHLSFKFETAGAMLEAQAAVSRLGVASESFGFDPGKNAYFNEQAIDIRKGIAVLGSLAGRNGWEGLRQAALVALHGPRPMQGARYSAHMTFDGIDTAVARAGQHAARRLCRAAGGSEIPNTLPMLLRSSPFGDLEEHLVSRDGKVWLSVTGLFAYSQVSSAASALEAWCVDSQAMLIEHGISISYLTVFQGGGGQLDASVSWADAAGPLRRSLMTGPDSTAERAEAAAATRRVAAATRKALRDLFDAHGACHIQIGKYYCYGDAVDPNHWGLLRAVKQALDPLACLNPGAIGLPLSSAGSDEDDDRG